MSWFTHSDFNFHIHTLIQRQFFGYPISQASLLFSSSDPMSRLVQYAIACSLDYQQTSLPETGTLPSVFYRALGKDGLCRVPNKIHSAKKKTLVKDVFCRVLFFGTRQNASLPSAFFLALVKDVFCRVLFFGTR